jgi:hypothetical protein
MQAHQQDQDAGNDRQNIEIARQGLADDAGGRTKRDEHRGEAEHKANRGNGDAARSNAVGFRVLHLVERHARQIGEIGRHDRQNAGRKKRHQARQKSGSVSDIDHLLHPPVLQSRVSNWQKAMQECDC